jgi:hypothetical protein
MAKSKEKQKVATVTVTIPAVHTVYFGKAEQDTVIDLREVRKEDLASVIFNMTMGGAARKIGEQLKQSVDALLKKSPKAPDLLIRDTAREGVAIGKAKVLDNLFGPPTGQQGSAEMDKEFKWARDTIASTLGLTKEIAKVLPNWTAIEELCGKHDVDFAEVRKAAKAAVEAAKPKGLFDNLKKSAE